MLRLYEYKSAYDQVLQVAEEFAAANDGEIPDSIATQLEQIEDGYESKLLNCGHVYKNLNAEAAAIKLEEESLRRRRQSLERQAEWLKRYIAACAIPGAKFQSPTVCLSWRKSIETMIDDVSLVPQELCKVKIEPSKTMIKEALQAGQQVPGCRLQENINLQIK